MHDYNQMVFLIGSSALNFSKKFLMGTSFLGKVVISVSLQIMQQQILKKSLLVVLALELVLTDVTV